MNRLQFETSPYLLQHAHNPVDWFAWKPEAFERARAEGKPILVSIGYSTCHWCHVMERESFENQDIASVMNEHFVCIKVDREERPDVDHIYMEACQILAGSGGWPLNCFLTPEGKPFFAGTYYPPRPAHGRPSWLQLLLHMANVWETRRADAEEQAEKLMGHIRRNDDVFVQKQPAEPSDFSLGAQPPMPPFLENIFYRMREQFDRAEGGFGGAPKFPSAMSLHFLLDYHHLTGNAEAREHALFSLDRMIFGGIYDQIGGGFARYATDREWLVPHFEKMLYDNALLVRLLAEAYKLTQNSLYRVTIEETLGWLSREMTHPEGGFYSALDADSEGVEGKFYVWQKAEIEAALGDDAPLFCQFYGASEHGNWEETNILWRECGAADFAEKHDFDAVFLQKRLRDCREKLLAARERRVRPGLDDKALLGWNALMASGLAAAFAALGCEEYRSAAVRNVDFLLEKFAAPDGGLLHTWKNGAAQYEAFLEDYAFLIAALVDVHQVTFEPRFLREAERLTERVLADFHDPETGLFFFTGAEQADVPLRRKDLFDNATPSGNSTMAQNLQRLAVLLGRREWSEMAARMLAAMRETVERYPLSFGRWAAALLAEARPGPEIAVVGESALAVAEAINARFLPNKTMAASRSESSELPLLAGKQSSGTGAWIYVCRDFACQKPVKTLEDFAALVER